MSSANVRSRERGKKGGKGRGRTRRIAQRGKFITLKKRGSLDSIKITTKENGREKIEEERKFELRLPPRRSSKNCLSIPVIRRGVILYHENGGERPAGTEGLCVRANGSETRPARLLQTRARRFRGNFGNSAGRRKGS